MGRKDPKKVSRPNRKHMESILDNAERIAKDMDGFRMLDYKPDGVYLSVFPAEGKGVPLSYEHVLRELNNREVTEVNESEVRRAVQEKNGKPVLIAPPQKELVEDGKVKVELTRDLMEAVLTVYPPQGGNPITFQQAEEALKNAGVVFGIDPDSIHRAIDLQEISQPVTVARGRQPEDGHDARIEYKFKLEVKIKPQELEDGRVDFHNLNLIDNVNYGDVLVTRNPPTDGVSGMTVTGRELPAKPGKDERISPGKNTELVEDGCTLLATTAGHVHIINDKVEVDPVYEVKGDVDFSSGNINYVGTVIVKGSITYGFHVQCDGDLEVGGSIDGGSVKVGGNLQVKKGLQGQHKSVIDVTGSVFAKFIENATIKAGEDVVVGEGIMHSKIDAGRNILVGGRKGLIVGGSCRAGEEINAKMIGSPHFTATEIAVGIRPQLRQEYAEVNAKLKTVEGSLDKTEKALRVLKDWERRQGSLPPDKKILLLKLTRTQFQLLKEKQDANNQKARLDEEFQQASKGKVKAQNVIQPGVEVTIGTCQLRVRDQITYATLRAEGADIKVYAYNQ